MITVTIDDTLLTCIRAVLDPDEDLQSFMTAAAYELVASRERQTIQQSQAHPLSHPAGNPE